MTDWLKFCIWVSWQPFWIIILDIRIRTLDFKFQKSPLSFCTIYLFVKWKHIQRTVNTLTCLSVGWMSYHCLRRWSNIKTTLDRHFVFAGITTVILILQCSIWNVSTCASRLFAHLYKYLRTCANTCSLAHLRSSCALVHPCILVNLRKYWHTGAFAHLLTCAIVHPRTWACTCVSVHLRTCAFAYLLAQRKYVRTCSSTCILAYLRTCVLALLRICALAYLRTCVLALSHTCALASTCKYLQVLASTCASTCALAHSCILEHLFTCANTCASTSYTRSEHF